MRLVQFLKNEQQCLGLEINVNGDIINLNQAALDIPSDLRNFIENGEDMWKKAQRLNLWLSFVYTGLSATDKMLDIKPLITDNLTKMILFDLFQTTSEI